MWVAVGFVLSLAFCTLREKQKEPCAAGGWLWRAATPPLIGRIFPLTYAHDVSCGVTHPHHLVSLFVVFVRTSHYTERKKCGPRSGQKTTNKMRRLYTAETQLRRRFTNETQPQHHRPNRTHPNLAGLASGVGRSPPHAAPALSAGELSGETTCVEHTDSDNGLPSHQVLLRDESGSSWWSLDDRGAGAGGGLPTRSNDEGGSWPQQEHSQNQRPGNGKVDRSDGAGGVSGAHFGYNELGHGGLWSGLHSSTTGTGSGSAGSAGESWEDDESEEGLGQAEEEVAVLLLGLGKANGDLEGFSDDENDESGSSVAKPPARQFSMSAASQEWSV